MNDRKRSKPRHEEADPISSRPSGSFTISPMLLPTAPGGLARAGEHGVAGEPGERPAYPNAISDTTKVDSTSPSGLDLTTGSKLVSPGARLQAERQISIEHERYVARALKGHTTPASGALGIVGDVRANAFVVSCKRTIKKNVNLADIIEEACRYADAAELVPAVALRLHALADGVEKDWAVIPLRTLSALLYGRPQTSGSWTS